MTTGRISLANIGTGQIDAPETPLCEQVLSLQRTRACASCEHSPGWLDRLVRLARTERLGTFVRDRGASETTIVGSPDVLDGSRDNRRLAARPRKATDAFRADDWTPKQIDPDGLKYVVTISVGAHWFVIAVLFFELVYRPYLYLGVARYAPFPLLLLVLIGFNGYIHYRLLSNRPITWHWPGLSTRWTCS